MHAAVSCASDFANAHALGTFVLSFVVGVFSRRVVVLEGISAKEMPMSITVVITTYSEHLFLRSVAHARHVTFGR